MTHTELTTTLAALVEAERARDEGPRPDNSFRGRVLASSLVRARDDGRNEAGQAIAATFGWRYRFFNAHSPQQVRRGSASHRYELGYWRGGDGRAFDHVEGFTFNRRPVALLTHPYLPLDTALARVAFLGLDAYGFADSWYYPGNTCAVLCVRPGWHRDRLDVFPWAARADGKPQPKETEPGFYDWALP